MSTLIRANALLSIIVLSFCLITPGEVQAKTVTVEMTAIETELPVDGEGTKVLAWTFNGQFPGPVVRVTEGDIVRFKFSNPATNSRPHSMDFHAAETDFLKNYHE